MSLNVFILIVGLVLLTMAAINEAIALLIKFYEHDRRNKQCAENEREPNNKSAGIAPALC